jgi:hypothetical protein
MPLSTELYEKIAGLNGFYNDYDQQGIQLIILKHDMCKNSQIASLKKKVCPIGYPAITLQLLTYSSNPWLIPRLRYTVFDG